MGTLASADHGPVRVLTLNRPEVRNCVDAATAAALGAAIEGFRDDPAARVLIVTGQGVDAFCAGADLRSAGSMLDRPGWHETGPMGFSGLDPGKPTIAAIEGWCVAGGLELAAWCDFRVAGKAARFAALNRRWGVPFIDGGTQRLPRIVGLANALYLLTTGATVDAERAREMGLVQEVVPAGAAVVRALEIAGAMAGYPQSSLRNDRAAILGAAGQSLGDGLALERELGLRSLEDPELADGLHRFSMGERPATP
ncbi:MAG: enoyl-CoA hydratase-related protein [Candidatus Dormibacteria bacterium]